MAKNKTSKAKNTGNQRQAPRSARPSARPLAPDLNLAVLSQKADPPVLETAPIIEAPVEAAVVPASPDSLAPYVSEPALVAAAPIAEYVSMPSVADTLKGGLFAAKRAAARAEHPDHDEHEAFADAERAAAELHAAELRAAESTLEAPIAFEPDHVRARRNMLRRAVSTLVGGAALFAVIAGARVTMAKGSASRDVATVVATSTSTRAAVSRAVTDVQAAARAKADEEAVAAESAKTAPEVTPVADAGAPKLDADAAKALTKQSLAALERGNYKGAIESAEESVAADPTDANAYMYWGTALMETGKRAEAKAIFARCVSDAARGPKADCKQWK